PRGLAMSENTREDALAEGQYHDYEGYHIPWYVHLIWISFWLLTAYYTISYLLPAMRSELLTPP
ncbi:MAG TPA: hypothetical protein PKC45_19350, partial [Gemmatales bacterium]|nr:hypothetical protein [Gemmatales bacterium]